MRFRQHIALYLIFVLPTLSVAQNSYFETWTELGTSTEINDNVEAYFVSELRLHNDYFRIKSVSEDFGFSYKFSKEFKCSIGHKITQKNLEQGYFNTHTTSGSVQYTYKISKFRIAYRNKFEMSKNTYTNEATDLLSSFEDRNRLKIYYKRKKYKFSPAISIETFNPVFSGTYFSLSEIRYGAGISFDLKKGYEFELGYLYKQMFNNKVPESISVCSFALSKSF